MKYPISSFPTTPELIVATGDRRLGRQVVGLEGGPVDGYETIWHLSPGDTALARWPGGKWHSYKLERRATTGRSGARATYHLYRYVGPS